MFILLFLAVEYDTWPILNTSCPLRNITASLNCGELCITSQRECECSCLQLAGCAIPRCESALFVHDCYLHGDCVDKCVCSSGLLYMVQYTPQSTIDRIAAFEASKVIGKKVVSVIAGVFGPFLLLLLIMVIHNAVYCHPSDEELDEGFEESQP